MNIFFFLVSILFFLWTIRNILFWVALWQLKEYRFDRVFVHLKETGQGRILLFSPLPLLKWTVIFAYAVVVFNEALLFPYQVVVVIIFTFQAFLIFKEFFLHFLRKPVLTFKAIFIIFLTFFIIFLLFLFPLVEWLLWFLILDRFTPLLVAFFVFSLSFPTEIYRDLQIERAVKKIKNHKKLLVIAVTGSYGKSSTKDYIAQILGKRFRVLKTEGTNNTPIAIANTILLRLKKDTEIFIVEMGAYKRGEIAQMCQIVHPRIGVLTAVSHQHLSLFGNLENTFAAKYELIESLPKNGLALFNGNNKNLDRLYQKTKKKKALYQSKVSKGNKTDIFAFNINVKKTSVSFDTLLKNKVFHLNAPLIGKQNVENILPGIFIADYLGMTDKEIKKAVSSLSSLPKTMIYNLGLNGAALIDDTFNANPDAVLAALEYLKIYKGKKILVLQPMIELGKKADEEHYRVAQKISIVCDYLFLTNGNFYKPISEGVTDGRGNCLVKVGNPCEVAEFIGKNTKREDVVIFEGKETANILNQII